MVILIRAAQIVLLLVLAAVAVSAIIGMFRPETGGVEKVALVALVALCAAMGVGVTAAATRLQKRVVHH
jgi:hypothetical protein